MSLLTSVKLEPSDSPIKQEKIYFQDEHNITKRTKFDHSHKSLDCPICDQIFNSATALKEHLYASSSACQSTHHQCTACGSFFNFKKQFLGHKCDFIDLEDPIIRHFHPDNNSAYYACKFCLINNLNASQYSTYESYLNHLSSYHSPAPEIFCSLCDFSPHTHQFDEFLLHLNQTHQIQILNDCPAKLDEQPEDQLQHAELYRCGLCKYSIKHTSPGSHLNTHLLTHVTTGSSKLTLNPPKIYCKACKLMFQFQHDFSLHLIEHVRENNKYLGDKLYCPVCVDENGNTVEFDNNLVEFNSHVNRVHLNFVCGICKSSDKSWLESEAAKLQNGHSIEEHHKRFHLAEETVRSLLPNFMEKSLSKCLIEVENVFCLKCQRFFDSSASLEAHMARRCESVKNE